MKGPHGDGFGEQAELLGNGTGRPQTPGERPPERETATPRDPLASARGTPPSAPPPPEAPAAPRPGPADAALERAESLVARGSHDRAGQALDEALRLEMENPAVVARVASLLGAMGRFDDAERELRRAQRLQPDSVEVRAALGMVLFRRGLYAEAEVELRKVCFEEPRHADAHFYRGEALNRLGRVEEAMEVLHEAARLRPDDPRPYHTLGILFDRQHLPQQAARMYRRARELSGR